MDNRTLYDCMIALSNEVHFLADDLLRASAHPEDDPLPVKVHQLAKDLFNLSREIPFDGKDK